MVADNDVTKQFYKCFLCEQRFQFGRYVYDGNFVEEWGLHVCHRCRADNLYGIDLTQHPHAEEVLRFRSVPFKRNARGLIDIPKGRSPRAR